MSETPSKPVKVGWLEALDVRYWRAPSVLFLAAANLIPLYGVLFWGWDLFVLMFAYWIETGIIGFYTALHMVLVGRWASLFLVPFFIVHFGGFMSGHAMFLWALFSGSWMQPDTAIGSLLHRLLFETGLWIAVAALFVSHGASFVLNVLAPMLSSSKKSDPGYRAKPANEIMMTPYGRIVIMHVTIIIGAMLIQLFQTQLAAFVLLIGLKIVTDVAAHVRTNFAEIKAVTT